MKATHAVILYTPKLKKHNGRWLYAGRVQGVEVIYRGTWNRRSEAGGSIEGDYSCWCPATGHTFGDSRAPTTWRERVLVLLNIFNQLTVRDHLAPAAVHQEFMKIDEYAAHWKDQPI